MVSDLFLRRIPIHSTCKLYVSIAEFPLEDSFTVNIVAIFCRYGIPVRFELWLHKFVVKVSQNWGLLDIEEEPL